MAQLAQFLLYPKAIKLLEGAETLPEQADPKETPNPAKSKDITCFSPLQPGVNIQLVFGKRFTLSPTTIKSEQRSLSSDSKRFLNSNINGKLLEDRIIEEYAPNVVEGVKKLSNWAKNL